MSDEHDGPIFGPLSQPYPGALHALRHPDRPDTPTDSRVQHDLTDARHAQRFADAFGQDLKYDVRRGNWRSYDGTRWVLNDSAAVRMAVQFAKLRQADALQIPDRGTRLEVIKFAINAEGRRAIDNVLSLARHLPPMRDDGDGWDVDPWIVGCPNGVLDLRTGRLRSPDPADRLTLSTAVECDVEASAPRWNAFVDEIFGGDRELVHFVQKAVGYSLTGETSEQVAFVCVGAGANGKSTFLTTLATIVGDYAYTMPFSTVERQQRGAIPNDLAALAGRRFVTASEVNEGSRWNESRLKALTGCDPIPARFLHSEFFTFRPVGKFWFAVNHKPDARDDSHGFWRRLRLIPFPRTFALDKTLSAALMAEAPGILAWAIHGCARWKHEGLEAPAVVAAATAEYREDSDPLAEFLVSACEFVPDAEVGGQELYNHYRAWAQRAGLSEREQLTSTKFGIRMVDRLGGNTTRTSAGRVYFGIARKPVTGLAL